MLGKGYRKTPRNYDGTKRTTYCLPELLPGILHKIGRAFADRPDLILAAWPQIIGAQLAPMTKAVAFQDGFLLVLVKNSTLLSLLSTSDKPRIMKSLRKQFPQVLIKDVRFRIG